MICLEFVFEVFWYVEFFVLIVVMNEVGYFIWVEWVEVFLG